MRPITFLRGLLRRSTHEREMQEEMTAHLAMATERNLARGMAPSEAATAARREFGNVPLLQEEGRDARGGRWIDALWDDLRFAIRYFRRTPLTTGIVVLVLAMGIGVNSALFSLLQGMHYRTPPELHDPDRLVRIRGTMQLDKEGPQLNRPLSLPELISLQRRRDLFASVVGWVPETVALSVGQSEEVLSGQTEFVTAGFFATLGVGIAHGASLPLRDDLSQPALVAVISDELWRTGFASSPTAVGSFLHLNTISVQIVGIAPPRFRGPLGNSAPGTIWLPLSAYAAILGISNASLTNLDSTYFKALARLAPGVTAEDAASAAQMATAPTIAQMGPRQNVFSRGADAIDLSGDTNLPPDDDYLVIGALFGSIALLILLVACTNVSALLVGSAVTRRHEIAVRLSLGASRRRIVRQLITESALLAICGGILGLMLYWGIVRVTAAQFDHHEIAPDLGTALFTLAFATGTGILFGLSPALHATKASVSSALKESGSGATAGSRMQSVFITAQIAFTQPLLVVLGVTIAIVTSDGGHRPSPAVAEHVLEVRFRKPYGSGSAVEAQQASLRVAIEAMQHTPGVTGMLLESNGYSSIDFAPVTAAGVNGNVVRLKVESIAPGYFALLGVPVTRGREFLAEDSLAGERRVVIGDGLARTLWGGEDPIGKHLRQAWKGEFLEDDAIVIGVISDKASFRDTDGHIFETGRWMGNSSTYLVRTSPTLAAPVRSLQALLRTRAPLVPVRIRTLGEIDQEWRRDMISASMAAAGGGAIALLLASIGLYGMISLAVGQRRREIGIRLVLGAMPRQIIERFFTDGVRLGFVGLLLGLPLSLIGMRLVGSEWNIPKVGSLPIGVSIALVVLLVAAFASWLPARRAALVDPAGTLRME